MKVSIVTAYYNRWNLFEYTLKTINKSKYQDFELIVVDDCSAQEHRLEERLKNYKFPITLIRLEKENKFYTNPCIPFNIGFTYASGEIILLQNPECFHLGQVIQKASTINNNDYLIFSCYNLGVDILPKIQAIQDADFNKINNVLVPPVNRQVYHCEETGWYNHPTLRDTKLHFACAIKREDMKDLGGFDERYAFGVAYDDNDLVNRILKKKMNIYYSTVPIVCHQTHGIGNYIAHGPVLSQILQDLNRDIYEKFTMPNPQYKVLNDKKLINMIPQKVTRYNQ